LRRPYYSLFYWELELGAGVVKKRIALPGRGKSGGARTLLATNKGNRWFFLICV
jgi:hypothetical protein